MRARHVSLQGWHKGTTPHLHEVGDDVEVRGLQVDVLALRGLLRERPAPTHAAVSALPDTYRKNHPCPSSFHCCPKTVRR
jgi:hypothetical protein